MGIDTAGLQAALTATVDAGWAPGLAVAARHGGQAAVVTAGTYAVDDDTPITGATPFRIASVGKPVAGVLAGRMLAEGALELDDAVDPWLPELRDHRVLVAPDSSLGDTVPSTRPISIRDLLTSTMGIGAGFDDAPAQVALRAFATGPMLPPVGPDEFMARLGRLPFQHQPGARWGYHAATEVLSVLLARVAGMPLGRLVDEQLSRPLGLTGTGFWTDARMPTQYRVGDGGLESWPEYGDQFARPPRFEGLAGGLVSTADDQLRFFTALADGELLPPALHERMTTDRLDAEQRLGMLPFGGEDASWGWQIGITVRDTPFSRAGAYGWSGGSGTTGAVDPGRGLVGVGLSQRFLSGPDDDFGWLWRPLLRAIGEPVD